MAQQLYKFQGITLVLDYANPDTPAIVRTNDGRHSSTYDCAVAQGDLSDAYLLSEAQQQWLESPANEERVAAAYNAARAGNPAYK
jgi:hypothetical protein